MKFWPRREKNEKVLKRARHPEKRKINTDTTTREKLPTTYLAADTKAVGLGVYTAQIAIFCPEKRLGLERLAKNTFYPNLLITFELDVPWPFSVVCIGTRCQFQPIFHPWPIFDQLFAPLCSQAPLDCYSRCKLRALRSTEPVSRLSTECLVTVNFRN